MERRYEHDCDACIFLGHHEDYDLHICLIPAPLPSFTCIARYGDEGHEYLSWRGPSAAVSTMEPIREAYRFARLKNALTDEHLTRTWQAISK